MRAPAPAASPLAAVVVPAAAHVADLAARPIQVHRVPLWITLCGLEHGRWCLRLTLPGSFGVFEARVATEPELAPFGLRLPRPAVGDRFGDGFSGPRLSLSIPD